jgi:hypothetical protein
MTKNHPQIDSLELTRKRWYPLRYHPTQAALWASTSRFNVVPAGRRSGKTEICGKRKLVLKAMKGSNYPDCRVFAAAPTRDQAKRIYWSDLKKMVPKNFIYGAPSESHLFIPLINGSEIHVLGMDKPERIEGTPWDHGCLDEIGNMKAQTWREHVRPALADRKGSCDFIGVPEGRNHYYDLAKDAQADDSGTWGYYHWFSADILDAEEIAQAKRDLDELTYKQEFEGSFVMFAGMAYYNFSDNRNVGRWLKDYDPQRPLVFALDFNESPGVATVIQEMKRFYRHQTPLVGRTTTAVIGEVFIPRNSNTIRVCKKLIHDWGKHKGEVYIYGDSTGGAGGSAKVEGSDWDLVKKVLTPHFGARLHWKVPNANPRERVRVNSMNSRLFNMYNETYLGVDASCTNTIKDFEGVRVIEGGTGEIDKKRDQMLTHLTDSVGYYIHREYPVVKYVPSGEIYWK